MNNTYVAIMAGGIGSRFWPASRQSLPKQFLDILGVGKSLIQLTYERFLHLCPKENVFVVTNKQYAALVRKHLPDLTDNQILCEPSRNNTGPCVAYTAFKLMGINPDANMVVAPSDHIILNEQRFIQVLESGLEFSAQNEALLTLGIQPSHPHTGYGYIQFEKAPVEGEVHKVKRFTEKPELKKAEFFLDSGDYLWNAGIFIWKAKDILAAFRQNATEIYDILQKGTERYNTEEEQAFVDEYYPKTPSISVDYAIMERAENIYTIPSDFGWSDLGSWGALYEEQEKDEHQNVIKAQYAVTEGTSGCLVRAPGEKLIILKGLKDFIIVDERDVLLIFPRSQDQEIKRVTQMVKDEFGDKFV